MFIFEHNKIKIDLNEIVKKYGNTVKFSNGIKPSITLKIKTQNEKQTLKDITTILGVFRDGVKKHLLRNLLIIINVVQIADLYINQIKRR